ncbi:hypothetical protein HELRODRAFT_159279 [Helobdella robusta]|uniref:Uncharacterized protein n=1 Tax=Helobdella robusta TaxID=6412 RepID=T1ENT7_HELRO|nr:hypothetical protein HELRODRAFT_159279 [Helobdella robusta]ESO12695.1 hypothetical protein HELRODRAFT_159279 [Helobdella robusta]
MTKPSSRSKRSRTTTLASAQHTNIFTGIIFCGKFKGRQERRSHVHVRKMVTRAWSEKSSADEKDEDSDARRVQDDEDDDVQERRVAPGYLKSSLATHAPILFNPLNLTEGTRDNQMKVSVAASSMATKSSLGGNNKQFAGSNLLISSNHNISHNINYNINSFNKNNNSNNFFTQQNTSFAFYSLFNQHLIKQQMQQQQRLQQQIISDPSNNNNNNNIVSKSGNNFVGNDVNSIVNTSDISDSNNTTFNNINDINNNISINNNSINNHMQLSHSYNCLAKQLHDTERHVIQLRKGLLKYLSLLVLTPI